MTMGVMDGMMTGGAVGFKFDKVGATISGRVVDITQQQDHLFQQPEKLLWWNRDPGPATGNPADRPKMVFVFTLATELSDGTDEDSGERAVWCRGNLHTAVRDAIRGGLKKSRDISDEEVIGGVLKIQHHGVGKATKGNPPKLYRAKFEPPQVMSRMDDDIDEGQAAEPDGRATPPMEW
jgi:hypothetical protein